MNFAAKFPKKRVVRVLKKHLLKTPCDLIFILVLAPFAYFTAFSGFLLIMAVLSPDMFAILNPFRKIKFLATLK